VIAAFASLSLTEPSFEEDADAAADDASPPLLPPPPLLLTPPPPPPADVLAPDSLALASFTLRGLCALPLRGGLEVFDSSVFVFDKTTAPRPHSTAHSSTDARADAGLLVSASRSVVDMA
jgi:hypothetical protein